MATVHGFVLMLRGVFPEATIKLSERAHRAAADWVDVENNGELVAIAWHSSGDIGITRLPTELYSHQTDKAFSSTEDAIEELKQLLGAP